MARPPKLPLLVAAAAAVCLLPAGWALRCYHCDAGSDRACRDPFVPGSVPLEDCSHPQQMCVKITYYESRHWVERRCAFMGGSASWRSGHVYTCGDDACNAAAPGARRSLLLLALLLPLAAAAVW